MSWKIVCGNLKVGQSKYKYRNFGDLPSVPKSNQIESSRIMTFTYDVASLCRREMLHIIYNNKLKNTNETTHI